MSVLLPIIQLIIVCYFKFTIDHQLNIFTFPVIEIIENSVTIQTLSTAIENGKTSEDYFDPTIMTLDTNSKEDVISSEFVIQTKKGDHILDDSSWIKLKEDFVDGDASYAVSSWMQFWILYQRFFAQGVRNKRALSIQFAYYFGVGVLFGSCYYNNGNNGNMMYNHLKFYVGVTIFASFSRLFIPIILCKYIFRLSIYYCFVLEILFR